MILLSRSLNRVLLTFSFAIILSLIICQSCSAQENKRPGTISDHIENFNVVINSGKAFIKWSCLPSEVEFRLYIERSEDGYSFDQIGDKIGYKSTFFLFYSYIDPNPLAQVSYYKIKYVQADGSVTFSDTKQIVNNSLEELPNSYETTASLN